MTIAIPRPLRVLFFAAFLAPTLATAPRALAQGAGAPSLSIVPGTRVRVTASNLVAPLIANFLQMRGDTAIFIEDAAGRGIWSIQVAEIKKIERSDGERTTNRPSVVRGAAIGGGIGLAAGILFAARTTPSDSSRKYNRAATGALGAGLGALIGGAIGSRFATERWTNVPVRLASILPSRRGISASLSVSF